MVLFLLEKYKINKLIVFIMRTLSIQFKLTLTDNYLNIESLLLRKI
ncbi:N-acetylmuramoyl-L-alanine amidase [Sporosarcina newyorkensis 2681]|uniref:N-acetylmuramoyl-L-alanine amidase n=1 Tax=Sporosarcina newyorkensis 2681 TaxID=1027292 RepID=F9DSD1_9BACL|nr:N-acetylmuramoyl-L-alanine amidase [Sporosarcina newyorkensis 2681]